MQFDESDGMCPNCVTPWKCNGPHDYKKTPYSIREQKRWKEEYAVQQAMEESTPWRYCPWCGSRLMVAPSGHICGYSDAPD